MAKLEVLIRKLVLDQKIACNHRPVLTNLVAVNRFATRPISLREVSSLDPKLSPTKVIFGIKGIGGKASM